MEKETIKSIFEILKSGKNSSLSGRYLRRQDIEPELEKLTKEFHLEQIGFSVLEEPIYSVTFGSGTKKILAWSQMHGNESTTTKAVFDLLKFFHEESSRVPLKSILASCTIKIIPMLNPDGAARYTRENINAVDLNRDAKDLKEKESRVLRKIFHTFKPDFCINLHDQRTIFSAGNTNKPATLSFLAPAMDEGRTVNHVREKTMQLISSINADLDPLLSGQIGRYDDAFNKNCTGDTFTILGVPTLLFEAGHFQEDYLREETRSFVALAIFSAIFNIIEESYKHFSVDDYFQIPENTKNFYDVILRNAVVDNQKVDVALQFEEKIKGGRIAFEPKIKKISIRILEFGHKEMDCRNGKLEAVAGGAVVENDIVNAFLLNKTKLSIEMQ